VHGGAELTHELESAPVRRILVAVMVGIGALALVGLVVWWPVGDPAVDEQALGFADRVNATIVASELGSCPSAGLVDQSGATEAECLVVSAHLTGGASSGEIVTLELAADAQTRGSSVAPGDKVVLNDGGPDVAAEVRYSLADMQRSRPLWVLAVVFAVVVVALGRLKGLMALAGIVLSLGVLLVFVFPALLDGAAPIGVALTGATIIAFFTFFMAHGVNDRTVVALLGTMASLGLTAALAVGFSAAAQLSGLASEDALTLSAFAPSLDFKGLLLAAIIIGTLGVLDDVTITQVSAVWELYQADPDLGARQLYGAGVRIGRDHIASAVNTLILAYTAAALPLLLMFTQSGLAFGQVLTTETVAVEIVQTLVGSIGLVASVPLTTALACLVITRTAGLPDRPRWGQRERAPDPDRWQGWPFAERQQPRPPAPPATYPDGDPWRLGP
jgi:uncharacterized membrane protein